jgi:predicted nucleic acid-binding protein
MSDIPTDPVLLDACCLLNLYASGRFQEIAETFSQLTIAEYVVHKEALFIRKRNVNPETDDREKVELESFISSGLIRVISINSKDENETYVDLASELGDGEAISITLALHNHCIIATDDRKALRVISKLSSITSISTLEIVKKWSDKKRIHATELKQILLNMLFCANYQPGEREPLYRWWESLIGKKQP